MRRILVVFWILASVSCAETVRCPDGEVFDEDGDCVPIPDAAGEASDGG
jgi:hypothetical protein